jgi:hypothetical protein
METEDIAKSVAFKLTPKVLKPIASSFLIDRRMSLFFKWRFRELWHKDLLENLGEHVKQRTLKHLTDLMGDYIDQQDHAGMAERRSESITESLLTRFKKELSDRMNRLKISLSIHTSDGSMEEDCKTCQCLPTTAYATEVSRDPGNPGTIYPPFPASSQHTSPRKAHHGMDVPGL